MNMRKVWIVMMTMRSCTCSSTSCTRPTSPCSRGSLWAEPQEDDKDEKDIDCKDDYAKGMNCKDKYERDIDGNE